MFKHLPAWITFGSIFCINVGNGSDEAAAIVEGANWI